jgi:hypothetical protein
LINKKSRKKSEDSQTHFLEISDKTEKAGTFLTKGQLARDTDTRGRDGADWAESADGAEDPGLRN